MDKFSIEKMALCHLDDIMEIEKMCYGAHHWSRDSFTGELDNPCAQYITAVDTDGRCIGYMGVWKIFDEAHITNLAVNPSYQRKGIARLLLLSALENCAKDDIKFMTLEVRKSNEKAIKLYENFGFKSLGIRKKYYQDNGEDALIMWTENIFSKEYKEICEKNKKRLSGQILK